MTTPIPPPTSARLQKAFAHVESLLIPNEVIVEYAIQRRGFALTHRRVMLAATNGRLIEVIRGLLGGFTPITTRWQDVQDVEISAGVFGASLSIKSADHPDLASQSPGSVWRTYSGFIKVQMVAVYRIAQAQDQAWRERRRMREMEEKRAISGGFNVGSGGGFPGSNQGAANPGMKPADRLKDAKQLFDEGLLTDSEYEVAKSRIIGDL
jgi:hypothetical protein